MPQTNLKPESGAEFFGKIAHLWRTIGSRELLCWTSERRELGEGRSKFWMCATEAAAQKWIEVQAALLGFPKYMVVQKRAHGVDRLGRDVGRGVSPLESHSS